MNKIKYMTNGVLINPAMQIIIQNTQLRHHGHGRGNPHLSRCMGRL